MKKVKEEYKIVLTGVITIVLVGVGIHFTVVKFIEDVVVPGLKEEKRIEKMYQKCILDNAKTMPGNVEIYCDSLSHSLDKEEISNESN